MGCTGCIKRWTWAADLPTACAQTAALAAVGPAAHQPVTPNSLEAHLGPRSPRSNLKDMVKGCHLVSETSLRWSYTFWHTVPEFYQNCAASSQINFVILGVKNATYLFMFFCRFDNLYSTSVDKTERSEKTHFCSPVSAHQLSQGHACLLQQIFLAIFPPPWVRPYIFPHLPLFMIS